MTRSETGQLQEEHKLVMLQQWMTPKSFKSIIPGLSAEIRHYLTERATMLTYCKAVRRGDVVFDLGANHGDHTRMLAAIVGEHGSVQAFEPNPLLAPALKKIGPNVVVHQIAVSDHRSVSKLHIPDGLDSWASLTDRREILPDKKFQSHDVQVWPLDDVGALAGLRPSFVKIDVEGHELGALRGMAKTLNRSKPVIVLENPDLEICKFFESIEYRLFDFFGDSEYPLYTGLFNAIAVPYGFMGYENLFLTERDYAFMFFEYLTISELK